MRVRCCLIGGNPRRTNRRCRTPYAVHPAAESILILPRLRSEGGDDPEIFESGGITFDFAAGADLPAAVCGSLSRRRMIFPERVLGRAVVKRMSSGRAMAPDKASRQERMSAPDAKINCCIRDGMRRSLSARSAHSVESFALISSKMGVMNKGAPLLKWRSL